MTIIYILLWFIPTGIFVLYCKYWLIPVVKYRFSFLMMSLLIWRMARKKKDPEARRKLMELSKAFRDMVFNKFNK
jgi:hypothetical protein